ncbi:transcriptional regulator, HxlR family [Andreprevotia lacus DSM 23236]|uniref:Transcriptional regulator, HxlR family n=2 Tax=Andreprevotia TaxID=397275 RepID=A0A1W1X8V3_9NEIS|nr:transcriptional regulator, HxlR family [Andreprevotia lacus DSM 23236]
MMTTARSYCPISLTLDMLGDRWSLLLLRDMMFAGKRHFREFLQSAEGISTNILAERLARLVACGILTRADDPGHKQKAIYSLTAAGINLLPLLVQLGAWGARHCTADDGLAAMAQQLAEGGPQLWAQMQGELARVHGVDGDW